MEEKNRLKIWQDQWEDNDIGWHRATVHNALQKYSETILKLNEGHKRIFVPLCGKSIDMKWFYEGGHTVVGVEAVESSIVQFFSENKISFNKTETSYGCRYENNDGRIAIHIGDLFEMNPSIIGKFDIIWDRGSLVAIDIEDREKYAVLLKSLFSPKFCYFLAAVQYEETETFSGPPRNISTDTIKQLFGDVCQMEMVGSFDMSNERKIWKLNSAVIEGYYHLAPKPE